MTGPRLGWLLGGLGSLLWLPIMGIVWMVKGGLLLPLIAFAVCLAGVVYLFLFAPWRYPATPIRTIYLGFLGILLAGAVVTIVQYRESATLDQGLLLPVFWVLLIPLFSLGCKSWSELQPHDR
ncbi:MAG: hypothetical protein ACPMAQ_02050 [Phycisphaerae bacterium]